MQIYPAEYVRAYIQSWFVSSDGHSHCEILPFFSFRFWKREPLSSNARNFVYPFFTRKTQQQMCKCTFVAPFLIYRHSGCVHSVMMKRSSEGTGVPSHASGSRIHFLSRRSRSRA